MRNNTMRRSSRVSKIVLELIVVLSLLTHKVASRTEMVQQDHSDVNFDVASLSSTSSLVASLWDIFSNIEDQFQSLLDKISSSLPGIMRDTEKLLMKLTNRLMGTFMAFGNEFDDMFRKVNDVQNEFQLFSSAVNEKFEWAVTYLNETLMNHTESVDAWAASVKQHLRSANDTQLYREGCQMVDDFIRSSSVQLRKCCNITIKPMQSLCRRARDVVSRALRILADALDRIQTCLEDKNSYLKYMVPCVDSAYDDVIALTVRVNQLRKKLSTILPIKILHSKCCIAIVVVEMEQQQNKFGADLFRKRTRITAGRT